MEICPYQISGFLGYDPVISIRSLRQCDSLLILSLTKVPLAEGLSRKNLEPLADVSVRPGQFGLLQTDASLLSWYLLVRYMSVVGEVALAGNLIMAQATMTTVHSCQTKS